MKRDIEKIMQKVRQHEISVIDATDQVLVLFGVSNSNFMKFEKSTEVPQGVYKILTDKGRIIQAEMIFNRWMEYDTPIHDGEKVIGYYC